VSESTETLEEIDMEEYRALGLEVGIKN